MRILVTGCGGFLGRAIARRLVGRGDQVFGLVRRPNSALDMMGIRQILGDVRQAAQVDVACREMDAVIHTAALAGIWGRWSDYYETNTLGTIHCLKACQSHQVPVFVHCSSPSVTFDGRAQSGIDESAPYPQKWLCHYPHSKALAEQEVLQAHQPGKLHTLALRPHLIWGPDDPHLLPRLVERARSGRLRIIGSGLNRIDTVHVENAALAHVLALDRLRSGPETGGKAYFITQDEPVGCWDWIGRLLGSVGSPPPERRISLAVAYRIGAIFEGLYRILGRQSEPPMTRFLALQLALDHWFDISAAKSALGYRPEISTDAGIAQLRSSLKAT